MIVDWYGTIKHGQSCIFTKTLTPVWNDYQKAIKRVQICQKKTENLKSVSRLKDLARDLSQKHVKIF